MRSLLVAVVLLLGCRTQPLTLDDDLASRDLAHTDPRAVDLSRPADLSPPPDMPACGPTFPDGYCPPATTCCPFSCWGGNDQTGWCAPGNGCPLC